MISPNPLSATVSTRGTHLIGWITFATLCATAIKFGLWNGAAIAAGGNTWIHGEWLINYAAGIVRRGASGAVILTLSDILSVSPMIIVGILQTSLVMAIAAAVLLSLRQLGMPPLLSVLSLSPAFMLFWLHPLGTHGKELLGYLTFLPLLYYAAKRKAPWGCFAASIVIYLIAGLFYEPNVLFGGALLMASSILWGIHKNTRFLAFSLAALCLSGTAILLLTFVFPTVSEWPPMCDAVLLRGVDQTICEKFGWSGESFEHALAFTSEQSRVRSFPLLLLAIGAIGAPLVVLFASLRTDRALFVAIILQALVFSPLYLLGIDYGRWMHIQMSSIIFLILIAALAGRFPDFLDAPNRLTVLVLLTTSFLWAIDPVSGRIVPGALAAIF